MENSEDIYSLCGVSVRLVFCGQSVDPDLLTATLNIAPIRTMKTELDGSWGCSG